MVKTLKDKQYDVYLDWKYILGTKSEKFVGILPMHQVHRRNQPAVARSAENGAEIGLITKMAHEGKTIAGDTTDISNPREYLSIATLKALESLEKNNRKGYFLMIESAVIDGYGHNNDSEGMIVEMKEFDCTLRMLVEYVNQHPETLLVVTADHETGGTGVDYCSYNVDDPTPVRLSFSTKGHTGTVVPVFAYGAGAESFAGVMKNVDLPVKIERLIRR